MRAGYERFSDFGSTTSPKAGLLWSPVTGLNLRTTFSRSFRAPLLFELSEVIVKRASYVFLLPDSQGTTPTLFAVGYNEELQPEKVANWTIGADITLSGWPGFKLSLTYFDIDFTDRIQTVFEGPEFENALTDPSYTPVVILPNPDADLVDY